MPHYANAASSASTRAPSPPSPQESLRSFADFDETAIFQNSTTNPTISSQHLFWINNPSQCQNTSNYLKTTSARVR